MRVSRPIAPRRAPGLEALRPGRRGAHAGCRRHHPGGARAGAVAGRPPEARLEDSRRPRLAARALVRACRGPLRGLDFFRVRRMEIAGLQYLAPANGDRRAGSAPKASVFDDPEPLERRVCALPGVTAVESAAGCRARSGRAHRDAPVALRRRGAAHAGRRSGRVLPFDPLQLGAGSSARGHADAVVAGVLARVRDADPTSSRDRRGVRVRAGRGARGRGTAHLVRRAAAEDIRAVTAVAQDLARQRAHLSGTRRAVRRPGDRPPDARMSPAPAPRRGLDLGSTKVVAVIAEVAGDGRERGAADPRRRRRAQRRHPPRRGARHRGDHPRHRQGDEERPADGGRRGGLATAASRASTSPAAARTAWSRSPATRSGPATSPASTTWRATSASAGITSCCTPFHKTISSTSRAASTSRSA